MPPITVGPGEGVLMGLGLPVILNNAHLKHRQKCPCVPTSGEGTWGRTWGTSGKAPSPPREGAGVQEGGDGVQPGARVCPLPSHGIWFWLPQSEFTESLGGKIGCEQGRAPNLLKPEGMDPVAQPGELEMSWG